MKRNLLIISFLSILFFNACIPEDDRSDDIKLKEFIKDVFIEDYLWYKYVPKISINESHTPEQYFESLLYTEKDKWSFMLTYSDYKKHFEDAAYIGYGFSLKKYNGYYYISAVFSNSPADKAGIKRGWRLNKIDDIIIVDTTNYSIMLGDSKVGSSNTFEFKNELNIGLTLKLTKVEIKMNMVLNTNTYTRGSKKVGYMVFYGFIGENTIADLGKTFSIFKNQNINEFILDLRYNSGGELGIALALSNYLVGKIAANQPLVKLVYNDKNVKSNVTYNIRNSDTTININRIFIITTESTASASELIVNGLKPFIPVYTIGSNTSGKPVGMNGFLTKDSEFILFPVTFYYYNKNNEGDFFDGIPPSKLEIDDVAHNWGENEACVKQALNFIEKSSFISTSKSFTINKGDNNNYIETFNNMVK